MRSRSIQLLLLALGTAPWHAHASLGGAVDSIAGDQSTLHAQRRLVQRSGYVVHELQLASGTTVREFVSTGDVVFAVTWRGPELPDLRQILGESFGPYQKQIQQQHRVRSRRVAVNSPQLVAENHGTMRLRFGYAFVPALLPATVKAEDIRP